MTARRLTLRQLNRATLDRQSLLRRRRGPIAPAIGRLAGLQAQHANSPFIAAWSRQEAFTMDELEAALEQRSVVRATVMRGTLHIVEAADFFVFDTIVTEMRLATWASTMERAKLDAAELNAALLRFCKRPRTVAEMEAHLDEVLPDAKLQDVLPADVRHAAFRLASAGGGLVHAPPSGTWKWFGKPSYVDARVGQPKVDRPEPDAALAIAAERYLAAYGPASQADFSKWLGQTRVGRVQVALAGLGDRLVRRTGPDGQELLDLAHLDVPDGDVDAPARFLARWDSAVIAYADRERLLPSAHRASVIKKNGDILPTFLVDGFVAGLWWVAADKVGAVIRLEPFGNVAPADRAALEEEAEGLVRFVEPEAARHSVEWA